MADKVTLNKASGTFDAMTDEVTDGTLGTGQVQYVKLMDGTIDGVGKALVSARGLAVDLAPTALSIAKAEDAASANADVGVPILALRKATPGNTSDTDGDYEFVQISGGLLWTTALSPQVTVSVDVARPSDTTQYGTNEAWALATAEVGGTTFTGCARVSGGSGTILDAVFTTSNPTATVLQGELLLFDSAVTAVNDNAALGVSDAEIKTLVAVIPFTIVAGANNGRAQVQGPWAFTTVGSANLRGLIQVKNAYTPASAETLTIRLKIAQN